MTCYDPPCNSKLIQQTCPPLAYKLECIYALFLMVSNQLLVFFSIAFEFLYLVYQKCLIYPTITLSCYIFSEALTSVIITNSFFLQVSANSHIFCMSILVITFQIGYVTSSMNSITAIDQYCIGLFCQIQLILI